MAYRWYVKHPDRIDGPFSSNDIRQQASDGRITPETRVSRDNEGWVKASQVRGLYFGIPVPPRANTLNPTSEPTSNPSVRASSSARPDAGPMTKSTPHGATAGKLWVMTGDVPTGPFTVAQIHSKLESGEVTWNTLTCPLGGSTWVPLVRFPEIGPSGAPIPGISSIAPGPQPENSRTSPQVAPPSAPLSPPVASPWNPRTINWLGLLFTPMWSGIMAALNGHRLQSTVPTFVPLAVGFGYLIADILMGEFIDSYLVSLVLYLGSLWLLWILVLQHQESIFSALPSRQPGATVARWTWPAIAGTPLAFLVIFGFLISPLLPLEPRQVCERFVASSTAREAEKYTTLKLVPALEVLFDQKNQEGAARFELTDEVAPSPGIAGYMIGFRLLTVESGQHDQIEGVFYLVDHSDEWKIEEVCFTAVNQQQLETWFVLSRDYPLLRQDRTASMASLAGGSSPGVNDNQPAKPWYEEPRAKAVMKGALRGWFLSLKGKNTGKVGAGVLAVVVAGIASIWRRTQQNQKPGGVPQ